MDPVAELSEDGLPVGPPAGGAHHYQRHIGYPLHGLGESREVLPGFDSTYPQHERAVKAPSSP